METILNKNVSGELFLKTIRHQQFKKPN